MVSYGAITEDSTAEAKILACAVSPLFEDAPFGDVGRGMTEISSPFAQVKYQDLTALLQDQALALSMPQSNGIMECSNAISEFLV